MSSTPPTKVRFSIVSLATVIAFLMYLDRICLKEIVGSTSFKGTITLSQDEVRQWVERLLFWLPVSAREWLGGLTPLDIIKSAFFWAYALAQVPAGWLSDRFGARGLIAIYIATWSLFTLATSFSWGFTSLMVARLGCGLAEAGYYPASSGMLTRWAHVEHRALASSFISWGGRLGGALAPALTASVILTFGDWRWAGWIYGGCGVVVSALFWHLYREHPRLHPRCNAAEVALLAEGRGDFMPAKEPPRRFPFYGAISSLNLWMMNAYQLLTNIAWAFVVLSFSDYLKKQSQVDDVTAGRITSVVLAIGVASLPLGGWLSDKLTLRFGKVWGRRTPLLFTRFVSAGFYLLAILTPAQHFWWMALWLGGMVFFLDLALPATWATMQDISGRHQAQLFGWSNMWGNFGAALSPMLVSWVLKAFDRDGDGKESMVMCIIALLLAAAASLGINAARPVIRDDVAGK